MGRGIRYCCAALLFLIVASPSIAGDKSLRVDDEAVSRTYDARERITEVVEVSEYGRYSFSVSSDVSATLRLVDRMEGPGHLAVERMDRFLPEGEVKLIVEPGGGHDAFSGDITVTVRPFEEQNDKPLPRLPHERVLSTDLEDNEQRSYWIQVDGPDARWVSLEVAGRHLSDLRLWRHGSWLTDVTPDVSESEPEKGRPLEVRTIHTELEPGLYRVSAYGGPANTWARDNGNAPLHIRYGIPKLSSEGWSQHETSPFGVDRWRVTSPRDLFHLRLPEAAPTEITVGQYQASQSPFASRALRREALKRDSRTPWVTLRSPYGTGEQLLTVRRQPGASYELARLDSDSWFRLSDRGSGHVWIGHMGLSSPLDTLEPTAAIVDRTEDRLVTSTAIPIGPGRAWRRRFNLLDEVELFVEITEGGRYAAQSMTDSGARSELRIMPLMGDEDAITEDWRLADHAAWELAAGYYRLAIRPRDEHSGIADVSFGAADMSTSERDALDPGPRRAMSIMEDVPPYRNYWVDGGQYDDGQVSGGQEAVTVRDYPLELEEPLPLVQLGDRVRSFQLATEQPRPIVAVDSTGERLPIATGSMETGDANWQRLIEPESLEASNGHVRVRTPGDEPVRYVLRRQEVAVDRAPLESLPGDERRDALPDFPVLEPGGGQRVRFRAGRQRTWLMPLDKPGLWRLETTGLLSTRGSVRTRVRTSLVSDNANGIGRNFLIQRYLRQGDYQLTARTNGESEGTAGLQLVRTPVEEVGRIPPGSRTRARIKPGEALRLQVPIEEAGRYRIRARGLASDFDVQLAGPDGWPVVSPGRRAPFTVRLRPGVHELTVLPQGVAARGVVGVTSLEDSQSRERTGHGPHEIALNSEVSHLWREPESEDGERTPDRWRFSVPAAMDVAIDLGDDMVAQLRRRTDDGWQRQDKLFGVRGPWRERLVAGDYELAVRSRFPNNRLEYSLALNTEALPLGQQRSVSLPAEIPLSLDEPQLVRLASRGDADVAATLTDAEGDTVAANDDRANDWNFLISRRLPADRYTLEVEGTGGQGSGARTTIVTDTLDPRQRDTLEPGDKARVEDGDLNVFPLELGEAIGRRGLPLVFETRAGGSHGVALERRVDGEWRSVTATQGTRNKGGAVLTGDQAGHRHRLLVWSLTDVPTPIRVGVASTPSGLASERSDDGWLVNMVEPTGTWGAVGYVDIGDGRLLRRAAGSVSQWADKGEAFSGVEDGSVPARSGHVWLLGDEGDRDIELARVLADGGESLAVPVSADRPVFIGTGESQGSGASQAQESLRLWIASAPRSTPSLRVADSSQRNWSAADLSAAAVAPAGRKPERLRLALADPDSGRQPVQVSSHELREESREAMTTGSTSVRVTAGAFRRLAVPDEAGELAVSAGADTAALLMDDGRVEALLWSGGNERSFTTHVDSPTVALANPGGSAATFDLRWQAAEDSPGLKSGDYRSWHPSASGERIVDLPEAGTVEVAGAVQSARLVTDDGRIVPAEDGVIEAPAPGRLYIRHSAGRMAAWVTREDARLSGWGDQRASSGKSPGLLSLRAAVPTLARISRPDGSAHYRWINARGGASVFVPPGRTRIAVMPHDGGEPSLTLHRKPAKRLEGGPGPRQRLAPGGAGLFSFRVSEERRIGVGLAADREVAGLTLLNEAGRSLGEGIVQLHELAAGRYYLLARLPADEAPVAVRPAVVGLDKPEVQPPEAIRRRLRQFAEDQ